MSYSVKKNTITLTRGDTFKAQLQITDKDGNLYIPEPEDIIEFGVKADYSDTELLIHKIVPNNSMILCLNPEDTKSLEFGRYVYDMQITKASGEITTFITKSNLILTEEVT